MRSIGDRCLHIFADVLIIVSVIGIRQSVNRSIRTCVLLREEVIDRTPFHGRSIHHGIFIGIRDAHRVFQLVIIASAHFHVERDIHIPKRTEIGVQLHIGCRHLKGDRAVTAAGERDILRMRAAVLVLYPIGCM